MSFIKFENIVKLFTKYWEKFLVTGVSYTLLLAAINTEVFREVEERAVYRMNKDQGVTVRRDQTGNILVDIPQIPDDLDDLDPALPAEVQKAMQQAVEDGEAGGDPQR